MNTVEALKELYKSFGGKLTDTYSDIADGIPVGNYSVIPDCFAALAEIAGGSIELPVVTQADAGDVLTVGEDGKWKNEEPVKELPAVTASDNGFLMQVIDGAWAKSTAKLEVRQNESLTLDANGSAELTNDLNKIVLGLVVTVGSSNKPTDLSYKVSYKQGSSYQPYHPVITIFDGNTAYANKSVVAKIILIN